MRQTPGAAFSESPRVWGPTWLEIERAEVWPTIQRFLYLYFLLVSFVATKSLRDATFLDVYGARGLPLMYILLAALVAASGLFYNRVVDRVPSKTLFNASLGGALLVQVLFFFLYAAGWPWVSFVYYLFVVVHGVLIAQYWLFLARTYDIRKAKRLMVPIGAGGILGAITGGVLVRFVVADFPVHFLLLLSACSLGICLCLYQKMWRGLCPYRTVMPGPLRMSQTWMVFKDRYLRKLLAVVSLVAVTAVLVEYQMNILVEREYGTAARMASFFGSFYLLLSSAALMAQLSLAGPVLRRSGVLTALILLPLGITLGAIALVVVPVLWIAMAIRIWDGGIRHSLYRTASEILYLPLSELEKVRTKILLDVFVPRLAEGAAGSLLLLATQVLRLPSVFLTLALALLSGSAFLIGVSMRRDYVERLRQRIETSPKELARARIDFSDQTTLATISLNLNSPDPSNVASTIRILANADHLDLVPPDLILHPSVEVKREVVRALRETGIAPDPKPLRELFHHPDAELAADAIRILARSYPFEFNQDLEGLLRSDRPEIRAAAAATTACGENEAYRAKAYTTIRLMAERPGERGAPERRIAAGAIGRIGRPEYNRILHHLLEDEEVEVVRSAIDAAGRTHDLHTVTYLIDLLGDPRFTQAANQALSRYGAKVIGTLFDFLRDEATPFRIRVQIPNVLREIQSPEAFEILQYCLVDSYPMVRSRLLGAIHKMQRRNPALRVDRYKVQEQTLAEIKGYFELLNHYHTLYSQGARREPLVFRALRESTELSLGNVFRSLDLVYPKAAFYRGFLSAGSAQPDLRPWAEEMVDTVVRRPKSLRESLMAIIGSEPLPARVEKGSRLFGFEAQGIEKTMEDLCTYPDHFLVASALYSLYELNFRELFLRVRDRVDRRSRRIQDTLAFVSQRFEGGTS